MKVCDKSIILEIFQQKLKCVSVCACTYLCVQMCVYMCCVCVYVCCVCLLMCICSRTHNFRHIGINFQKITDDLSQGMHVSAHFALSKNRPFIKLLIYLASVNILYAEKVGQGDYSHILIVHSAYIQQLS